MQDNSNSLPLQARDEWPRITCTVFGSADVKKGLVNRHMKQKFRVRDGKKGCKRLVTVDVPEVLPGDQGWLSINFVGDGLSLTFAYADGKVDVNGYKFEGGIQRESFREIKLDDLMTEIRKIQDKPPPKPKKVKKRGKKKPASQ
jgi:hypothetical protein